MLLDREAMQCCLNCANNIVYKYKALPVSAEKVNTSACNKRSQAYAHERVRESLAGRIIAVNINTKEGRIKLQNFSSAVQR